MTDESPTKPRNLVLLSDGTGQRGGPARPTNVWRTYLAVDVDSPPVEQLKFHDNGVGIRQSRDRIEQLALAT